MGFWQKLRAIVGPAPAIDAAVANGVKHAIDVVDPVLRVVGGVEQQLAPSVTKALDYCATLVEALPSALPIDRSQFAIDPMVHAIFAAVDDIDVMLGRSSAVQDFLADGANAFVDDCYAVVGMRCKQKTMLGMAQQGSLIEMDVPRQFLYFTDHTLRELSSSEAETRRRLQFAAFDSLVRQFSENLAEMRKAKDELQYSWGSATSNAHPDRGEEKSAKQPGFGSQYQERVAALAPEQIVKHLVEWLSRPDEHIRLEPWTATVDRLGALVDADAQRDDVCTLQCPMLIGRDRRRWLVMLVKISCAEARAAVVEQMKLRSPARYIVV